MVGLMEETRDLTTAIVVPDPVRKTAAAALSEREIRQAGGTLTTVTVAAQLAVGQVPVVVLDVIERWHAEHPDEVRDDRCTLAAGLMGGVAGRNWVAAVSSDLREARTSERKWRAFSEALNTADRKAGQVLFATAEQAAVEALRRAGVKLKVRVLSRSDDPARRAAREVLSARVAAMPCGWGPAILSAASVTEEELLDRALESFEQRAAMILTEAEREKLEALAILLDDDDLVRREEDTAHRNAQRAAAWLATALLAVLMAKVRGDTRGENQLGEGSDSNVAFGLVVRALALGSGAGTMMPRDTPDGVAEVLVDQTPLIQQLLTEANIAFRVAYTWIHGFYGRPLRFFRPHANLDGQSFESRRDERLRVSSEDSWLGRVHYAPGDHVHCTCNWSLSFTPGT